MKYSYHILTLLCGVLLCCNAVAWAQQQVIPLPVAQWRGETIAIAGLPGTYKCTIGYPVKQRVALSYDAAQPVPAGLYLLRLCLRPSHVSEEIAWHSGLNVTVNDQAMTPLDALYFGRMHQPEWKSLLVTLTGGQLSIKLAATVDPKVFKSAIVNAKLAGNGTQQSIEPDDNAEGDFVGGLSPTTGQYFALDAAELVPLSHSGAVAEVSVDKIRYAPGDTLHGHATVCDVGGKGGHGTLTLYLEHDVNLRDKVKDIPVTLTRDPQVIAFDVPLPARELGYALVAAYSSPDGADRSEAAEYFNITDNFFRVAIHGNGITWENTKFTGTVYGGAMSPARVREILTATRKSYHNCGEMFAWAEDDMLGMSQDTEWWFSGQTGYHPNKAGLRELIRLAHEQGIACSSYVAFCMDSYLGWKTAYDYPNDNKAQYDFPVGTWEGVETAWLDRGMNDEYVPFEMGPRNGKTLFAPSLSWDAFWPITPDNTPRMTRLTAEGVAHAVELFGWDGMRWDCHPRGGGQMGGGKWGNDGSYDYDAARRTQALMRYFKDIVTARYPKFRYGYNYLLVQDTPDPRWGTEDFELDELCRGGGLLMNESIRNSAGKPFEWIARNIAVEGDLCRERGAFLLGISCDAESDRDQLVEAVLYAAGGCRPQGRAADCALVNRYNTRYSRYTYDETLRRLEKPESVLKPAVATPLWWQPFVYETAREHGASQLVVNLLDVPRTATPKGTQKLVDWTMSPGTDPFVMELQLPEGYTATGAHLIDPFTLAVMPVTVEKGRIAIPVVKIWLVLVVDLQAADAVPTLSARYGPPVTFGVKRPEVKIERIEPKPLDITKTGAEANKDFYRLIPQPSSSANQAPDPDTLSADARAAALLKIREAHPPEAFYSTWWKGGTLPDDVKQQATVWNFGDLAPRRNGCLDIYYARGAMDYRLRLGDIFAGLSRYQVHEAGLEGIFRAGGGHWLRNGITWQQFPDYDLLLYTSIPHCAIGVENSYALPAYVKAGGAVFFTGGEYAFGKGGYMYTVLERELLPVLCLQDRDVKYVETPLALEPGKDFDRLGIKVNFAVKPAFYCYNQVALKNDPDVLVFLKAGNRPILVGRQLGKGRVACLLLDHRGKSEAGTTMFFDWQDWPALMRAVIAWLTPTAGATETRTADQRPDFVALRKALDADTASDTSEDAPRGGELDTGDGGDAGVKLDAATLKKRVPLLQQLLLDDSTDTSLRLAGQLATVTNLPSELHDAVFDYVLHHPAPTLADIANRGLASRSELLRENGLQLLAIASDPAFARLAANPPPAGIFDVETRDHALACAMACYPRADLLPLAREKVAAWNKREHENKMGYTNGQEFTLAAPEQPCLDTESLYARIGWLAYLSRHDADNYGAQFAREWLLIGQYIDDANVVIAGIWNDRGPTEVQKRAKVKPLNDYIAALHYLDRVTTPAIERLLAEHPAILSAGFARAHFLREVDRAVNLLARYPAHDMKPVLAALATAPQPQLATFATVRLQTAK